MHILVEEAAALLAFVIGGIALIRFYSRKNNAFLLIGTGFIGTALLDGFHALIASPYYAQIFTQSQVKPMLPEAFVPWSGLASRLLLASCLFLSWFTWKREQRRGPKARIAEFEIYAIVGILTVSIFLIVTKISLPGGINPRWILNRPQELIPGVIFLAALVGYLRKEGWKQGAFEHWLVLALIANVFSQCLYMSSSSHLYNATYFGSHLLRVLSYLFVLIGLLISMLRLFRQAEAGTEGIRAANLALVSEMAERERAVAALRLA
jgi:hypothetical protein